MEQLLKVVVEAGSIMIFKSHLDMCMDRKRAEVNGPCVGSWDWRGVRQLGHKLD